MPLSGFFAIHASTALAKPYQPGSIRRHCAHENTHGMARRSSISRVSCVSRAAADVERRNLVDHGRGPEVVGKSLGLVDEATIGLEGQRRQLVHRLQIFRARRALFRLQQARLQRRSGEYFEVAAADFGIGIFARDDFTLLGDPDLAVHRAAGLRDDGIITRPAAAADRTAAAMETDANGHGGARTLRRG